MRCDMCHGTYSCGLSAAQHPIHALLAFPLVAPASRRWGLLPRWQAPPDELPVS